MGADGKLNIVPAPELAPIFRRTAADGVWCKNAGKIPFELIIAAPRRCWLRPILLIFLKRFLDIIFKIASKLFAHILGKFLSILNVQNKYADKFISHWIFRIAEKCQ